MVGINLEDSLMEGERRLLPAAEFAEKLADIRRLLDEHQAELFINVRTDPYIMGMDNGLEETLQRIEIYQDSGADGIFIPFITTEEDIAAGFWRTLVWIFGFSTGGSSMESSM